MSLYTSWLGERAIMNMTKIYRPLIVYRILDVVVILFDSVVFALLFLFFFRLHVRTPFLVLFVGSFLGFLLFTISRILPIRLEISDKGITYFSGYYIISTSWENVERVGTGVPNNLLNVPVEGLVLRTPSAIKPSLVAS